MNKKLLLIPLLVLALLLTACGGKNPDTPDTPDAPDVSTTTSAEGEGQSDSTTSTTGKADKTTKPGETSKPADNVVDWGNVFGDDDTTATAKGDKTTKKATTSTTKKTITTTAPTVKPTTIDKVTLPAVGTDVDGKGRIKISAVDLKDGVLTITIRNYTDEQKTQWITEETDYVTYACYDKEGNVDPKVVRATMGAVFSLRVKYYEDFSLYRMEQPNHALYPFMLDGSIMLEEAVANVQQPYALVFGNEGSGLPAEFAEMGQAVRIPHNDKIDSLNLSIAVGIGAYAFVHAKK